MEDCTTQSLIGQRFLIAEDEALIAMLLEDVIERCGGMIVATVDSCEKACKVLSELAPDAIILDVHLQGGTSEDVIAIAKTQNIPVLICTGSDPESLPAIFRNMPILMKPWNSEDAEQAFAQLCGTVG